MVLDTAGVSRHLSEERLPRCIEQLGHSAAADLTHVERNKFAVSNECLDSEIDRPN